MQKEVFYYVPSRKSDKETVANIQAAIKEAVAEGKRKYGQKWSMKKNPLRDGDEEKPNSPEYKDCYFLNCSSYQKVEVFDASNNKIDDESAIYGGVYGRISINFFPYSKAGNLGVGVGLRGFKKQRDGDPLSSRGNVISDFLDDDEAALLA